jgi:hypothetical protein
MVGQTRIVDRALAPDRDPGDHLAMAGPRRSRPLGGLALLVTCAWLAGLSLVGGPPRAAAAGWTGGIDLYRAGAFTTQQSWLWCTAADVQIIRNIVRHDTDHATSSQRRYFAYMRAHNRYDIPVSDGVDPAGWTAGLRHYVDARYRLVASRSFDAALRSAVTNLRLTHLPVGITVSHGNHAWVLTGFTATADPAVTSRFTITSVRVTGPLWGLQSRSYGYDMRPDTKLTPRQLRGFFTAWHYAGVRMAWEGRWVSIQPTPSRPAAPAAPASSPSPTATPRPSPLPSRPVASSPSVVASPSPSTEPSPPEVALVEPSAPIPSPPADNSGPPAGDATGLGGPLLLVVVGGLIGVALAALAARRRRA